jgi:heme-degrading monooxygenase HmoA
MIQIIWEFVVRGDAIGQFEQAYGPDGAWVRLFRAHPGFRGTTLLRDTADPRRYVTIDHWETGAHRKRMMAVAKTRYSELDRALADLTESEEEIGTFTGPAIASPRRRPTGGRRKPGGARRRRRRTGS